MKLKTITTLLLIICIYSFKAQEIKTQTINLEQQFDNIYRKSSSYQEYKVISKEKYKELKQNVSDSINALKSKISQKEKHLKHNNSEIKKVKETLNKTKADLDISISKEKSISFFGATLSKTNYNLILWTIIIILLISLGYFIFKFFRSNQITKDAQKNLIEVENEFEIHRKKSLEREQKLRRKLQDEINKQRNS